MLVKYQTILLGLIKFFLSVKNSSTLGLARFGSLLKNLDDLTGTDDDLEANEYKLLNKMLD